MVTKWNRPFYGRGGFVRSARMLLHGGLVGLCFLSQEAFAETAAAENLSAENQARRQKNLALKNRILETSEEGADFPNENKDDGDSSEFLKRFKILPQIKRISRSSEEEEAAHGRQYIHVKGSVTPGEEVSGVRADYLNKELDLGPLGKQSYLRAPWSAMTTTHDVMMDQQLRTMEQALQYDPSVQWQSNDMGASFMRNRGFISDGVQNSRIDGLNVSIQNSMPTEQFQQVTVLNGAASALYGPENSAGMTEMQLKRPTKTPFFNFNFGYDSAAAPLESIDTSFGKGPVKVRFNYLNQTGRTVGGNSDEWRNLYSGDIDIQLAKHTKLELDGGQYNYSVHGVAAGAQWQWNYADKKGNPIRVSLPNNLKSSDDYYIPAQAHNNTSTSMGVMKLKHDFTQTLHLTLGGLYQSNIHHSMDWMTDQLNDPGFCAPEKNAEQAFGGGPCISQSLMTNKQPYGNNIWSNTAHLNWDTTDPIFHIRHHFNVGSNGYTSKSYTSLGGGSLYLNNPMTYHPYRGRGKAPKNWIDGGDWPLYGSGNTDPNNAAAPPADGHYKSSSQQQQTLMFGDSFDVGDYFTVLGEMSWGWIYAQSFPSPEKGGDRGGKSSKGSAFYSSYHVNGVFSPSVALDFHPTKHFSAYFNWGLDTQAGPTAPETVNNAYQIMPPVKSQQFEGGVKYLYRNRFLVSLDGFGMGQPFYMADKHNNYAQIGKQYNAGMEFQVSGEVAQDVSMFGGVTYLDPFLTHAIDPAMDGKRIVGLSHWTADFLMDWHPHFLHGVSFNSNVHYVGPRPVDPQNKSFVNQYVSLDLGVRYNTKIADHLFVVRGNVDNVTDMSYWQQISPNAATGNGSAAGRGAGQLGAPRTWHITASYYF